MIDQRPITAFKFTQEEYDRYQNGEEIWRTIELHPMYLVSSHGRFKSNKIHSKGDYLHPYVTKSGYLRVTFCENGKVKREPAHRIVALAFVQNPYNKPQINHDNGVKDYNFPHNLFWCTQGENNSHAYRTGLAKGTAFGKYGVNSHSKIVTVDQFSLNGVFIKRFYCIKDAARELGVSGKGIYDSVSPNSRKKTAYGFIWKYADK